MPKPWYQPETAREAVDAIEDVAAITAFLKETCTSNTPDKVLQLSEDAQFGLFCLYGFLEGCLTKALDILAKEV